MLKQLIYLAITLSQQLTPDQQKILDLEHKVEELERRLAADEAKSTGAPAPQAPPAVAAPIVAPAPVAQSGSERPSNAGVAAGTIPRLQANTVGLDTVGPGGFTIQSPEGDFLMKIGADLQSDIRSFSGKSSASLTDQMVLRRVRPTIAGTVYRYIDYFFRPDFGLGSTTIYDAYLQANYVPHAAVRAGKFKPPVGLERLQSDDDTTFIERGLPTLLVPSRAIGFQLSGDIINHRVGYQAGVFDPVPDNSLADTAPSNARNYAARIFSTPFQPNENFLSNFGIGFAAQGGSVDGLALPAYKTAGQNTFFSFASGVISAGHRTSIAPQAFYYLGPFGVLAEDTVTEEGFQKGAARREVAFRSWQVQVSWILTGERKSYGSPIPKHRFDLRNGGWGAFEIAARTGDFRVDPALFAAGFASLSSSPDFAREWVVGGNWYLNRIFRISTDYAHTSFLGGAVGANKASERVILARFQLNFI